jgi:cytochrome bd-type quinol oxidase subunit 2
MSEGVISMKRSFLAGLALIFVIGLQAQPARAQDNSWNNFWAWITHGQDPRLTVVGIGVGAAATGASYAMVKKHGNPPVRHVSYSTAFGVTTFGCMVVYPMVATVVLNRPLTPREAYIGMAECAVPIIGGWVVDAILPHDAWTDGLPQKTARR